MDKSRVLAALAGMANETRLDLLRLLVRHAPDGLPQGEIARELSTSASGLAFHLTQLEQAGLVVARRESRNVFYSANTAQIGRTIGYILSDCCLHHPEIRACCDTSRRAAAPLSSTSAQEP